MEMGVEVLGIELNENCTLCIIFNETAELSCRHTAPYTVVEATAVDMLNGDPKNYPGYVNNMKICLLRDSESTPIEVRMDYVRPHD